MKQKLTPIAFLIKQWNYLQFLIFVITDLKRLLRRKIDHYFRVRKYMCL